MGLLLIFSVQKSSSVFTALNKATGNYLVRQDAAHDVMEASDYLTEMAQRFTLDGDPQYMEKYFEEAFTSKRRENAIVSMAENDAEQGLIDQIQSALNASNNLMYTEYYAMKLVVDAKEIRDYPETLKGVELRSEDEQKSSEKEIQDLTDKYIKNIDEITERKQKEILEI
ncbi:MAG: ribosome recycling factor [Clostridia bacterium]|nr:ribosome recycling factor [Clostridia bacterium]